MPKYVFAAVFTKEENGQYSVTFNDIKGCYTCGDNFRRQSISNSKRTEIIRNENKNICETVSDYSVIRAKYFLADEDDLRIVLPEIRLKNESADNARIHILYNGKIVCDQRLSWYGNELGKTLHSISVSLPSFNLEADSFRISVRILCDYEEIYNSEETLYRQIIVFSGENETSLSQIKKGEYTVITGKNSVLSADNAYVEETDLKNEGFVAYYCRLDEGYMIMTDEKPLISDDEKGTDIHIIPPQNLSEFPPVIIEACEYYMAYYDSVCKIVFENTSCVNKFALIMNNEKINFEGIEGLTGKQASEVKLKDNNGVCRFQIINLNSERIIFDRSFIFVSKAEFMFNREFYYSERDYKNGLLHIEIDDYSEEIYFSREDEDIAVPFKTGMLNIPIPKVKINETTGSMSFDSYGTYFIDNIPGDSMLKVINPKGTDVIFVVNGKNIMYDGGGNVTIGNILQSFRGRESDLPVKIEMVVKGRFQNGAYGLAQIYTKERFIGEPKFWTSDNILYWNRGGGFIGRNSPVFTLNLTDGEGVSIKLSADENCEALCLPENMKEGNYNISVSIPAKGLFGKPKELYKGVWFIGDENKRRFKDKCIEIDHVTDVHMGKEVHVKIKTCCISDIEYMGKEDTSEGLCHVYRGIMYQKGEYGEKYIFSDKEKFTNNIARTAVNPVRIIYINNSVLSITNPEGDGIYYCRCISKLGEKFYRLTDYKYKHCNKNSYFLADLYLYKITEEKDGRQSQP